MAAVAAATKATQAARLAPPEILHIAAAAPHRLEAALRAGGLRHAHAIQRISVCELTSAGCGNDLLGAVLCGLKAGLAHSSPSICRPPLHRARAILEVIWCAHPRQTQPWRCLGRVRAM
eukprot:5197651-Prymnesium_polylepis.1